MDLSSWLETFIRHKDIFHKKIEKISKKENKVIVEYKDKVSTFLICPSFNSTDILNSYENENITLVTLNTRENLDFFIKSWDKLSKHPMLCVYFVNPNSAKDKKWVIYPFTHERICDKKAIKKGLLALFESVQEYTGA